MRFDSEQCKISPVKAASCSYHRLSVERSRLFEPRAVEDGVKDFETVEERPVDNALIQIDVGLLSHSYD